MGYPAALTAIEHDKITDLVGSIRQDEGSREQVRKAVLGREAQRQADDSRRGQPGGGIDLPGKKKEINRRSDDDQQGDVVKKRERSRLDEMKTILVPAQGIQDEARGPYPEQDEDDDSQGLENSLGDPESVLRQTGLLRRHSKPQEEDDQEDRAMHQLNELVIDGCLGFTDETAYVTGEHPGSELCADDRKNNKNQCLDKAGQPCPYFHYGRQD